MEKILSVEIFLNLQLSTKLQKQPQKLKPAFQESCHRVLMHARERLVLLAFVPNKHSRGQAPVGYPEPTNKIATGKSL